MKILWIGYAPWSSRSYSVITRRVVPMLAEAGHQVVILSHNYDGAPQLLEQNILLLGAPFVTASLIETVVRDSGVEAAVLSNAIYAEDVSDKMPVPFAVYSLFHVKEDFGPGAGLGAAIRHAQVKMVMSKYGQEQLGDLGIRTGYVPMCAPGEIFNYHPRQNARQMARLPAPPGAGIVTMVASMIQSTDHKGYSRALMAFAEFSKRHKDVYLYLHANLYDDKLQVTKMIDDLGIGDGKVLFPFPEQMALNTFSDVDMAAIYQASDALISLSRLEGFNLPLIEAQMCGCPVIASDNPSHNENVLAGWKVKTRPIWDTQYHTFLPETDHEATVEALEAAYQARNDENLRLQAAQQAACFDSRRVFEEYWRPALAEIERLVERRQGKRPVVVHPERSRGVERPAPEHRKRRLRNKKPAGVEAG